MYIHKCYWVELIVSSTFGFVVLISFVVISSLSAIGSSIFMSFPDLLKILCPSQK